MMSHEAQSVEGKVGITGEWVEVDLQHAKFDQPVSEFAAAKAKVVKPEAEVANLNEGAESARIAQATAESQAALECQAELALASGMRFIDSLRALLGRPAPAPSQGPELEPRQLCQPCQGPDGGAKLADGLPTGPLHSGAPGALGRATKEKFPGVSLVECSAAAGGQDPEELAGNRTALADFLCIEKLDGDEQALVQRVLSRLIEEKKRGGRTLWSITTKIFGMSQCELDLLVDAYNTFGLCPPASACAADAGSPGADAAAGEPGDTHSAAGAQYMPEVEPEAPSQPEPDDAVEPPPDSVAVYCEVCVIWLNGPKQYESHSIGRKHRKRERDRSRAKSPAPLAPVDKAPCDCTSNGKVFQ